jgi:hypothetical protein
VVKFLFWMSLLGLVLYFAIGEFMKRHYLTQAHSTITNNTLRKAGICYLTVTSGATSPRSSQIYLPISLLVSADPAREGVTAASARCIILGKTCTDYP